MRKMRITVGFRKRKEPLPELKDLEKAIKAFRKAVKEAVASNLRYERILRQLNEWLKRRTERKVIK